MLTFANLGATEMEEGNGNLNNRKNNGLKGIGKGLLSTGIIAVILKFIKPLLIFIKPLLTALKFSKFGVTFISMFATVAVYALFWGWWFALGFVVLIFIHENGHMYAAKRIGLPVSKPVFIPFIGAFIAMKEMPKTAREEAIIGYGGPLAGTAASLFCAWFFTVTGSHFWLALGYVGFFINLFNLAPLGFLDGGRIVSAISYWLWIPGTIILVYLAIKFTNPIIFIVLVMGIAQAYKVYKKRNEPEMVEYYQIDPEFRFKMGLAYLLLLVVTGAGMGYTHLLLADLASWQG